MRERDTPCMHCIWWMLCYNTPASGALKRLPIIGAEAAKPPSATSLLRLMLLILIALGISSLPCLSVRHYPTLFMPAYTALPTATPAGTAPDDHAYMTVQGKRFLLMPAQGAHAVLHPHNHLQVQILSQSELCQDMNMRHGICMVEVIRELLLIEGLASVTRHHEPAYSLLKAEVRPSAAHLHMS